jgi:hypothetical protein
MWLWICDEERTERLQAEDQSSITLPRLSGAHQQGAVDGIRSRTRVQCMCPARITGGGSGMHGLKQRSTLVSTTSQANPLWWPLRFR